METDVSGFWLQLSLNMGPCLWREPHGKVHKRVSATFQQFNMEPITWNQTRLDSSCSLTWKQTYSTPLQFIRTKQQLTACAHLLGQKLTCILFGWNPNNNSPTFRGNLLWPKNKSLLGSTLGAQILRDFGPALFAGAQEAGPLLQPAARSLSFSCFFDGRNCTQPLGRPRTWLQEPFWGFVKNQKAPILGQVSISIL